MLTEVPSASQTKYIVTVKGHAVSPPCASRQIAESYLVRLSPDQQAVAEITPVTSGGQQLLFG